MFTFNGSHVLARAAKHIALRARDAHEALLTYWVVHLPVCLDPMQFAAAVTAAAILESWRTFRRWVTASKPKPTVTTARSDVAEKSFKEVMRT